MVDSVEAAVKSVVAAGGAIVQPLGVDARKITARFRDPGGNIIGLYQEPPKPGKARSSGIPRTSFRLVEWAHRVITE
jgi:hypothetical protein